MRRQPFDNPAQVFLEAQAVDGARTLPGEQLRHHDPDVLLVGKTDLIRRHAATEIMDDIAGLMFVPPAQVIDFNADTL